MTKVGQLLKQEGIVEERKANIIKILLKKFILIPEQTKKIIINTKDLNTLENLFDEAVDAPDLMTFEKKILEVIHVTKDLYDPFVEQKSERKGKLNALFLVLKSLLGTMPIEYIEKLNNASKEIIENILDDIKEVKDYQDLDKFLM